MPRHTNNIGVLRLFLASLVIFGHAPEMIDGNRSREPLTMAFGTLSLGELAVDGFFLLSGFLITQSMVRSRSVVDYGLKRIGRIVPGYVVAFLVSVFAVGFLVGGQPTHFLGKTLAHFLTLGDPPAEIAPDWPRIRSLNGAMWTIAYEFRCYVFVAICGFAGLLNRPKLFAALTVAALALNLALVAGNIDLAPYQPKFTALIVGQLNPTLRLTAVFMVGMTLFLLSNRIRPWENTPVALGCAVACVALMFYRPLAEAGLSTLGAVFLFWLAFKANLGPLGKINDPWDISYGTYLYGWPVAITVLYFWRSVDPLTLAAIGMVGAWALGAVSWFAIEKPAKAAIANLGRRVSSPMPASARGPHRRLRSPAPH